MVHSRLPARSDQSATPSRAASEKVVMLAIECSKPEPMKASSPHHRTANRAPSVAALVAIQTARQTSALHRTARQNSCGPVAAVLAATMPSSSTTAGDGPVGPADEPSTPLRCTAPAKAKEPTALPRRESPPTRPTERQAVARRL